MFSADTLIPFFVQRKNPSVESFTRKDQLYGLTKELIPANKFPISLPREAMVARGRGGGFPGYNPHQDRKTGHEDPVEAWC